MQLRHEQESLIDQTCTNVEDGDEWSIVWEILIPLAKSIPSESPSTINKIVLIVENEHYSNAREESHAV